MNMHRVQKKILITDFIYIIIELKKWKGIKEQLPKDDVMKIIIVKQFDKHLQTGPYVYKTKYIWDVNEYFTIALS